MRPRLIRYWPFYQKPSRVFSRLPWAKSAELFADGPLLVLAPHPDDESLGCGGLIAACCADGREVHVVVLTDGSDSHRGNPDWPASRLAALRAREVLEATSALGVPARHVHFLGAQDGAVPQEGAEFARLADRLTVLVRDTGASNLLTCWEHDPHPDHVAAALLADVVARRLQVRNLAYPVWGWLRDDLPQKVRGYRIDISQHLPAKQRAIAAHASQVTDMIEPQLRQRFLKHFALNYEVILLR